MAVNPATPQPPTPNTHSPFLHLPPELRLKIYTYLFQPACDLTIRSLFIRAHYRNVFMSQQPKNLGPAILRVCRQISAETLPILYALPTWNCQCRIEALVSQIGCANFARIKALVVDVDDLDLVVEELQRRRQRSVHRYRMGSFDGGGGGVVDGGKAEYAMQSVPVPESVKRALKVDGYESGGENLLLQRQVGVEATKNLSSRNLDFGNLEVLEVEGYQSAALNPRGTHRVRVEALRLCELAMQLLDFHPKLKYLLQKGRVSDGGADARDLTLGRVKWRFVKDLPEQGLLTFSGTDQDETEVNEEGECVVDLASVRSMLEVVLKRDESRVESSLPVAWTSSATGTFNLYPYLQAAGG